MLPKARALQWMLQASVSQVGKQPAITKLWQSFFCMPPIRLDVGNSVCISVGPSGGSRISGKGIHHFKMWGVRFADCSHFS